MSAELCMIPKCRAARATLRVGIIEGYICERHAYEIWRRVEMRDAEHRDEAIEYREARDYDRSEARAKTAPARRKPAAMGEIYYVRVNELIKVGWTTKLADRIRAYGPEAELLANYPGTRADEAALHRQLTPSRYRGREWYSDTPILQAFIAEAVAQHGPPRFDRIPWTEPSRIVAGKRHR